MICAAWSFAVFTRILFAHFAGKILRWNIISLPEDEHSIRLRF